MEAFLSDTTIHGVEFLEPKNKSVRSATKFVFFVAFCGLSFFLVDIYLKWQVNPKLISEEVNLLPSSDFPFPAVTICNPIFSRDQKPNLYEVLRNPGKNLTVEEQKNLAASIQASAPHLGGKFSKIYPSIDPSDTVKILKEKFCDIDDFFELCGFRWIQTDCERLWNYVLTDYGFCFSFNLQSFHQLFNEETLSDDFLSYRRTKIIKDYSKGGVKFYSYEKVDDDNDEVQWTLEGGYSNDSFEIQPTRASKLNAFSVYPKLNNSDISNLIPNFGKTFATFFHLPNEVLTPFHEPRYILFDKMANIYFKVESYKTDENLRRYPPGNRGCYFADEKPLKFFKSYTKSQCEFECLANKTLEKCKCVKFSMPRNNSTPICNLNQTSCYLSVSTKLSEKSPACECLPLCTFIYYKDIKVTYNAKFQSSVKYARNNNSNLLMTNQNSFSKKSIYSSIAVSPDSSMIFERTRISLYSLYNVFSDFGSILGLFFGCSVLSLVEFLFFFLIKIFKIKIKKEDTQIKTSEIATKCTVHGFRFIFDSQRRTFVRIFWTLVFLSSLGFCIKNSYRNYVKIAIDPEIEQNLNQKPRNEIPLPSITICSNVFAKNGLANNTKYKEALKKPQNFGFTADEIKYLIANQHRFSPNMVLQIQAFFNFNEQFKIVDYLNRSEFEIDELMFDCTLGQKQVECSKLFKRVLTSYDTFRGGICFSYNQQSFLEIFNEGTSSDFNSYGRYLNDNSNWTLDEGYRTSDLQAFPFRASEENEISVSLKVSKEDATNCFQSWRRFNIVFKKPNEMSHSSKIYYLGLQHDVIFKFSAKSYAYSQEFRKFSPEKRGCYFTNEKKLNFFKAYTEENCLRECITNETLRLCGCFHMSMPRNQTARVCTFGYEPKCYVDNIQNFPTKDLGNPPCGCLKTCNDIEYYVDKISREFEKNLKKDHKENYFVSRVQFKFSDSFIIEEQNTVGYNLKDFLTDLGGLLGLFLGCSTMSLVEVIYHPINALLKRFGITFQTQVHPAHREAQEDSSSTDDDDDEEEEVNVGASTSRAVVVTDSPKNHRQNCERKNTQMQGYFCDSSSSFESDEEYNLRNISKDIGTPRNRRYKSTDSALALENYFGEQVNDTT